VGGGANRAAASKKIRAVRRINKFCKELTEAYYGMGEKTLSYLFCIINKLSRNVCFFTLSYEPVTIFQRGRKQAQKMAMKFIGYKLPFTN
jgi:hypothetical protein